MAAQNEVSIKITVDKKDAETNVRAFQAAFTKMLVSLGKTPEEVLAFYRLFEEIRNGTKDINDLDAATRQLILDFKQGIKVAEGGDFLGVNRAGQLNDILNRCSASYRGMGSAAAQATRTASEGLKDNALAALTVKQRLELIGKALNEIKEEAIGAVAGVAALKAAAEKAVVFQDAMQRVAAITLASREQIEELGGQLQVLAGETGTASVQLANLAAQGASFGFPVEHLAEFTRLAEHMGVAFGQSGEQIAQTLGAMRNQYNLNLEGLREFADEIVTVGTTVGASAGDLYNVIGRIGAATKQFGLTRQEATALAASLLSMGTTAGLADNNINSFLLRLQDVRNASGQAADALYDAGIDAKKLADTIRDKPSQALEEFLTKLRDLPKAVRTDVLRNVFGREYADDAERLVGALGQYQKGLRALGETAGSTSGALQQLVEVRMATSEEQFKRLAAGITALQEQIGAAFLPAMTSVAGTLADATQALNEFATDHPDLTKIATWLAAAATAAAGMRAAFLAAAVTAKVGFPAIGIQADALAAKLYSLNGVAAGLLGILGKISVAFAFGTVVYDAFDRLYAGFESVRIAAGRVIEMLVRGAEDVRTAWEIANAVFTDDTIEAATKRHEERVRQLDATFKRMYRNLEEGNYKHKQSLSDVLREEEKRQTEAEKAAKKEEERQKKLQKLREEEQRQIRELREDMQKLGLDSEVFTTGITRAERDVVDAFKRMSENGRATSEAIMAGFAGGLEKLSTSAIPEMEFALQDAFQNNRISAIQLEEGLRLIGRRAAEIKADFTGVADATKALGIEASVAMGGMSKKAEEAVAAFDKLMQRQLITKGNFEAIFGAALKAADSTEAVNKLGESVERLKKQFPELEPLITRAMRDLKARADEVTPGLNSVTEAMQKLGLKSQESLRQAADDAKLVVNQLRTMNAPIEDVKNAWLAYAEKSIAANKGVASTTLKVEASVLGLTKQLNGLVTANSAAKDSVDLLKTAWEKQADLAKRSTEAVRDHGTAMVAAAQHALEMARITGDTLAIEEATVAVRQAEAKAAQELAAALDAEAQSAWANVAAMREKAKADGEVTEAEKQLIQAATDSARALDKQAAAAKQAAEKAAAASEAATAKKEEVRTVAINWDALAGSYGLAASKGSELASVQAKMWAGMQKIYSTGFGGLKGYSDAINAATQRAAAFVTQLSRVEDAAAGGDAELGRYISRLQAAIRLGGLLGREELAPLRRALKDAKDRMKGLADSARDTLNSLRDEVAEMNKNYDEIERRRADSRRAEIEAQLAIAKSAGNTQAVRDLSRALALLRQVSNAKIAEAAAREREDQLTLGNDRTGQPLTTAQTQDRVVVKVVDLNIKVGEQTQTAQVVEGSEEVIVDMLRKAQMVAN